MLTGESIPVFKVELPHFDNVDYDPVKDTKHTLYSGTEIIQCRKTGDREVTALIIRTNFNTTKGSLVKSIMFPKPSAFNFVRDSLIFVGIMGGLAMIGYFASIDALIKYLEPGETTRRFFDLITITVPPALPAAVSMGTVFALRRLKKQNIFCISPSKIDAAGVISITVFDKTGTLTEESLNVAGHRTMKTDQTFYPLVEKATKMFNDDERFWNSKEDYKQFKEDQRLKYLE